MLTTGEFTASGGRSLIFLSLSVGWVPDMSVRQTRLTHFVRFGKYPVLDFVDRRQLVAIFDLFLVRH